MLLDNFYHILTKELTPDASRAVIAIDPAHRILEGHFPGMPVVPGVCMMQIVREIAEQGTGKPLHIATADNMKFLAILDPTEHREIVVSVSCMPHDHGYAVVGTLASGTITFFKFKGTLYPAA
jgi:3-hydroxyacyl-[acyl-carrier-protein] dehydratase